MTNINSIDSTMGEESFAKVKPTLAAIPQGQIMRVGIDLHAAAIVAINAGSVAERPEIKARFLSLPESAFNHADLAELTTLGYAVWFARTEANGFEAKSSGTQAIVQLMARASEVRERMLRVIAHCFAEDETVSGEVAISRSGVGYIDMAQDLTRVAKIYKARADVLAKDGVWYRASDLTDALQMAHEILVKLGDKNNNDWPDTLARLWTKLFETYQRVRRTALFLFPGDPVLKHFPSMHAATRSKGRSSAADEVEEPGAEEVVMTNAPEASASVPPAPEAPVGAPVAAPGAAAPAGG